MAFAEDFTGGNLLLYGGTGRGIMAFFAVILHFKDARRDSGCLKNFQPFRGKFVLASL